MDQRYSGDQSNNYFAGPQSYNGVQNAQYSNGYGGHDNFGDKNSGRRNNRRSGGGCAGRGGGRSRGGRRNSGKGGSGGGSTPRGRSHQDSNQSGQQQDRNRSEASFSKFKDNENRRLKNQKHKLGLNYRRRTKMGREVQYSQSENNCIPRNTGDAENQQISTNSVPSAIPQANETNSMQNQPPIANEVKEPAPVEVQPILPVINVANIKQERKQPQMPTKVIIKQEKQPAKPPDKPTEKVQDSSSSDDSSDDNLEPGEIVKSVNDTKTGILAAKQPAKKASDKESSSSEESDSDTDSSNSSDSSKEKSKEKAVDAKSSENVTNKSTEEDIVFLGYEQKMYTITDDETDSDAAKNVLKEKPEEQVKAKSKVTTTTQKCLICDKRNHISFQCQMICTNCAAPYHSYKNCPNPPNLNTVMQTFLEYTMSQMNSYKPNQNFMLPTAMIPMPATVGASPSVPMAKIFKRAAKTAKHTRKKMKGKDDSDEEEDDDESADTSSVSESESSESTESSDELPLPVVNKLKRKRKAKQVAAASIHPQAYPFPLLPSNSPMMYPYGAILPSSFK